MESLKEIKSLLKAKSTEAGKKAAQKFIPTSQNVYGVRVPDINELVKQYKSCGFPLVEALWESGAYEERLMAAKLLGKCANKDPDKTLRLLDQFANEITDWAVCDTLAMQGIRPIVKKSAPELIAMAREMLIADYMWRRRVGLVLFWHFAKDPAYHARIESWIKPLESDPEHYIRKAIVWIRKEILKNIEQKN